MNCPNCGKGMNAWLLNLKAGVSLAVWLCPECGSAVQVGEEQPQTCGCLKVTEKIQSPFGEMVVRTCRRHQNWTEL